MSENLEQSKKQAAQAALSYLPSVGVVGLGSGSTAKYFIEGVGGLVKQGAKLRGVATSEQSRRLATELGIPLLSDEGPWAIDVTVDGADEVTPTLDLIKGGGACHTREKLVNRASAVNIIVVDETKLVQVLGERFAVPIEVLQFGYRQTEMALRALGTVSMRLSDGKRVITDAGNLVYDLATGPIKDPEVLDRALHSLPGVVETGLFLGRADRVIVAGEHGIRELTPPDEIP